MIFSSLTANKKIMISLVAVALVLSVLQILFVIGAPQANAGLWEDQTELTSQIGPKAFGSTGEPRDIRLIVADVIRVFLGLLGIIFVFLIVLAGYKWMTAGGDSSKVDEAKHQLQTAVIGLMIILASYSITVFVVECAVKASTGLVDIWYCPSLSTGI
jgi:hypothetical protein